MLAQTDPPPIQSLDDQIGQNHNETYKTSERTSHYKPPTASMFSAFMLGLVLKLGALNIAWHYGFRVGFWEFFLILFVVGFGYMMLALCMAEMVSIMAFSGGYYGYARCAMGPLGGFLVGCSGAMESIFYLAIYVLKIAQATTLIFHLEPRDEPIIWIVTYILLISFHVLVGKYYWTVSFIIGSVSLCLLIIYLLGSIENMNFDHFVKHESFTNDDGFLDYILLIRMSFLFFLGFDMVTVASVEVKDAKHSIPRVMLLLIPTLFILALWLLFTVPSQYPGLTKTLYENSTFFPLVFGYEKMFNMTKAQATFLTSIPVAGTALAYIHLVSRQFKYMATSGLLPSIFMETFGSEETPLYSMILVAFLALAANFFAKVEDIYTTSSRTSTIAGCFVYLAMFRCFVVFRRKFKFLERTFHNPFGLIGAFLGWMIFFFVLIVLIFLQADQYYHVTVVYFSYIALMLVYYYSWVETHQCFSVSEQKVFFKAYILNMQMRRTKPVWKRILSDLYTYFPCSKPGWSYTRSLYLLSPSRILAMDTPTKDDENHDANSAYSTQNQSIYSRFSHLSDNFLHFKAHSHPHLQPHGNPPNHKHENHPLRDPNHISELDENIQMTIKPLEERDHNDSPNHNNISESVTISAHASHPPVTTDADL